MPQDIPWLRGSYRVREFNGRATAEVDMQGSGLSVDRSASNTRLTVHTHQQAITVDGDVGGGAELHVVGRDLRRIDVHAPFENVQVRRQARGRARLQLPLAATRAEVSACSWTLAGGPADGGVAVRVLDGADTAKLEGDLCLASLEVPSTDRCDVNVPGLTGLRATASGTLHLHREPPAEATLTARQVIADTRLRDVSLQAQTAKVTGDLIESSIRVSRAVISGSVARSTIDAETVEISGSVSDNSRITATATDGPAITVGNGEHDLLPFEQRSSDQAWLQLADNTGKVRGSTLAADGGGYISVGSVDDAELRGTHIQVANELATRRHLTADTVVCRTARLSDAHRHRTRVGRLLCETLEANGHLHVSDRVDVASLTVRQGVEDTSEGQTACEGEQPDELRLLLTSDHVRVAGVVEGRARIARPRHLRIHVDEESDGNLEVRTAGHVFLSGRTVRLVHLRGNSRAIIRCTVDKLDASQTTNSYLHITEDGSVRKGRLGPSTTLRMQRPERPPRLQLGQQAKGAALLPIGLPSGLKKFLSSSTELTLLAGSEVSLRFDNRQGERSARMAASYSDLTLRLGASAANNGRSRTAHWTADLSTEQVRARLDIVAPEVDTPNTCPSVQVRGPLQLGLSGTVQSLDCQPVNGKAPRLHLESQTSHVPSTTGTLELQLPHRGSLHGTGRHRSRLTPSIERLLAEEGEGHVVTPQGRLLDIDLTSLPLGDLDQLAAVAVVDPTPLSMRNFARAPTQSQEAVAQRGELRMRAEKSARIANALEGRAVSGGSRAAARWAVARLHHDSLPPSTERVMRWPHRLAGYSQAPLHALAFFLVAVLTVTLAQAIIGDQHFLSALQNTVIAPFSLVRLTDEPIQLSEVPFVNLLGFAAIAVPFLYLLIALRNYLRSPADDGS